MADVFISYKREDRPAAERLAGALRQLGFEVWWDLDLLSGDSFRNVIRAVIDQCKAAVVVWSRASVDSAFVLDEANYALRLGRLCTVRIDGVELPFGFGQVHVDDLADWAGELSHAGFQSLVKAIEERVGRRAKLGTDAYPAERQTAAAELEAFKAAQLAASTGALRTFVENFPNGAFASFVRDQIESMEREAARRAPPRPSEVTSPAGRRVIEAQGDNSRTRRWPWAVVAVIGVASVAGGLAYHQQERKARDAAEASARRAEAERMAAERRAVELEAQASAARAAREPAEKRSGGEPQQKAEPERLAREKPPRDDLGQKRNSAAFSVDQLHTDVRTAVELARRNARQGEDAATRARVAAGLAEAAARRAAAGISGTISLTFEGGTYLGEGSGTTRQGYGVTSFRPPSRSAGDRFAGQYKDNGRHGVGVNTFAKNAGNPSELLRREGDYASNRPNGVGVLVWANGDRYVGLWKDGTLAGAGVRIYADGRRYEGDYGDNKWNGHGVLWSADGRVVSAGIWKDGKLVTPLQP